MEMSSRSEIDIDDIVEKLKKKYSGKKSQPRSVPQVSGELGGCGPYLFDVGTGIAGSPKTICPTRRTSAAVPEECPPAFGGALQEPFGVVTDACDRSRGHSEYEHIEGDSISVLDSHGYFYTETDVTLPSSLTGASSSSSTKAEAPSRGRRKNKQNKCSPRSPSNSPKISRVYRELLEIYDQLQAERLHQLQQSAHLRQWAAQLHKRESLLLHREDTLRKIQEVEQEAHRCLSELKEEHEQNTRQLNEALAERTKEMKRMKSSFESLKEMNDTLKKQLSDVSVENKRMESQSRKAKARLENLQRKYEYSMAQKDRENIAPKACGPRPSKQEKRPVPGKVVKGCAAIRLLVQMFDWVSGTLLAPLGEAERGRTQRQDGGPASNLQERCSKVLPLLSEQLQLGQAMEPGLHLPLLRFIYWSLRRLDGSPQHNTLTSTFRRLGEEVYRGTAAELRGSPLDQDAPLGKSPIFFKSPNRHARVLSTLIVLKTITQVDVLAQALDSLLGDLRSDEGRALFLEYQALPVVLGHLKAGNPCLLSLAMDVLLQMSVESGHLSDFLESCSTEDFFRSVSPLLCSPRLKVALAEKLSVLLQKLSKIRKNKRLFEKFTMHLTVQEMHRTTAPTNSFLIVNLSSILFNLGMTKKAALCGSRPDSP